ncbi:hypothetical protein Tco_0465070 [Tanacetum coccineum]
MVAFLEKSTGSAGFHQIIDFLNRSHICYALTKKPEVCVSFIKQFWRSAEASTDDHGEVKINATIDGHSLSITEGSLRRHLKLADQNGAFFTLMRFIQICLEMQRHQFQQHTKTYHVPSLTMKVFSNMKRPTKGFLGHDVALFPTVLDVPAPSTSLSKITSSPSPTPSPSPEPTPAHTPSPIQPSPPHPSPDAEHHVPTPHDSPLHAVHSYGSDEGSLKLQELMNLVTTLSDRIGSLEDDLLKKKKTYSFLLIQIVLSQGKEARVPQIKVGKSKRQARDVLLDDEVKYFQQKSFKGTKEGSEKVSDEVSTAGAKKGTATEEVPIVSTAEEEPKKKSKKELEQERLSYAKAIRLEEQMNEEQRDQIARDKEIAR